MISSSVARILFPVLAFLTLTPWVTSAEALILGTAFALALGNPYQVEVKKWTHKLLALSVVGLGAGMNLVVIGQVGFSGVGYTIAGILTAFLIGTLLGRTLQIPRDTSLLITVGTAICGGSAIAAVAPVIRAKHHEVTVALGIVFTLNAVALLIFPWIGHQLRLSQTQFGLWAALAIHDTSSVVGASLQYGAQALEVGTTVKLARALWIVPVAMTIGWIRARGVAAEIEGDRPEKPNRPWFILGFLLAAALVTWIPTLQETGHWVDIVARRTMVLTLFLIGSGLSKATLRSVGFRPFVQGVALWLVMASASLAAVWSGLINL